MLLILRGSINLIQIPLSTVDEKTLQVFELLRQSVISSLRSVHYSMVQLIPKYFTKWENVH